MSHDHVQMKGWSPSHAFSFGSDEVVCLAGATGFNTSFVKNIPAKPKEPLNSNSIKPNTTRRPVWHLYGVFQLSDQLACDSGMNPSLNVCNTSCTGEFEKKKTATVIINTASYVFWISASCSYCFQMKSLCLCSLFSKAFTDDDVTDDIACLNTIISSM